MKKGVSPSKLEESSVGNVIRNKGISEIDVSHNYPEK